MIPFPLGEGEAFGRGVWAVSRANNLDLSEVRPRLALLTWQRYISAAWRLELRHDGLWSGPCREAALAVQRVCGIPPSGVLDAETWEASWNTVRHGQSAE